MPVVSPVRLRQLLFSSQLVVKASLGQFYCSKLVLSPLLANSKEVLRQLLISRFKPFYHCCQFLFTWSPPRTTRAPPPLALCILCGLRLLVVCKQFGTIITRIRWQHGVVARGRNAHYFTYNHFLSFGLAVMVTSRDYLAADVNWGYCDWRN